MSRPSVDLTNYRNDEDVVDAVRLESVDVIAILLKKKEQKKEVRRGASPRANI